MKSKLVYKTQYQYTSIEISEDGKSIVVFHGRPGESSGGIKKLHEFRIEALWDLLVANLATMNVSPTWEHTMFRRRGEAIAALQYSQKKGEIDALR